MPRRGGRVCAAGWYPTRGSGYGSRQRRDRLSCYSLAEVRERKALEALQGHASLNNSGDRAAILANRDLIEVPEGQIQAGRVFVLEQAGSVVGFAVILSRSDGAAELDGLLVEPNRWGLGIGRRLVEHCANVARSQGSTTLHVVGNPHAEGFYAKCGFGRDGTIQLRFGVGMLFRKSL